ncbi:unnamed protein product, partial [Didymodactylos carnosus]
TSISSTDVLNSALEDSPNNTKPLEKEAVPNKFRLSDDIFKTEWFNLHETFLNKRRDIKKV